MVQSRRIILRPVGFFEELGVSAHYTGKMREVIQGVAAPNEQMIVDYLNSGYVLLDAPETAVDVITGKTRIIGASSLVSDGTWVWRTDLSHYLANYHLSFPADFTEHLIRCGYSIPMLSESDLATIGSESVRFF
jgi:hypothetical protein